MVSLCQVLLKIEYKLVVQKNNFNFILNVYNYNITDLVYLIICKSF